EDQVGEDVGRLWQMLVENLRLIRCVLTCGVRIERASKNLEREGELLCAARGSALENHVLEHMRDAHLLGALVKRRGANPRPQSDRPYSRHVLREYCQSVGEDGTAQLRLGGRRGEGHSRERPPSLPPRPPRERRGRSPRSPRSERPSPSPLFSPSPAPTAASAGDSPPAPPAPPP